MNERTTRAAALVAALMLTGCATSDPVRLPSGAAGFALDCTNSTTWQGCHEKARELCGEGGYQIVTQDAGVEGFIINGTGGTYSTREMMIACNG
jgi:hypothetical protein